MVWPLVARALLQRYWPLAADSLLDNDAAMRLEQMRDWVAGQDGLGHEQPRFAFPFESWRSRLIMASLAGMVLLFSRIF